ncbi:hypothetical protein [Demequina flava]|uniref:hypothetical protein n=1 Tax=Demequina flava TaxID=1095025 RepID=UPI0007839FB5|nr:hypothetical protein [Demequina flava]
MKQVIHAKGHYYVERKGNALAAIGAVILGAACFVLILPAITSGRGHYILIALLAVAVLGVPAYLLATRYGTRKRWEIAGVTQLHERAGDVVLTVTDTRQTSHDVVTDAATAHGLAHVFPQAKS